MSPETTPPGCTHHVAIDRDEVAEQLAVDVRGRPAPRAGGRRCSRWSPMLKSPRRAVPLGDGQADGAVLAAERAREPDLDAGGLAEIAEVDRCGSPSGAGAMACGAGPGRWRSSGAPVGPDIGDQVQKSVDQLDGAGPGGIERIARRDAATEARGVVASASAATEPARRPHGPPAASAEPGGGGAPGSRPDRRACASAEASPRRPGWPPGSEPAEPGLFDEVGGHAPDAEPRRLASLRA